jgi:tRNA-2-methylthio-N6-dimethylallyladenosine synthase
MEGRGLLGRARGIDLLVGTHTLYRVPELLEEVGTRADPVADLDRQADPFAIPDSVVAHGSPARAYVTVMEGCNHVCSFCVVPRTRGPEVNRPAEHIVREVESLVARGYPEVMLLGQTVNAYRVDGVDFAGLLRRIDGIAGLRRLRFTTSHPEHVTPGMADAFRDLPRLCPYIHLPVQSGANRILASMRRGYTREGYLDAVALLRDRAPGLALSTDVIVGYPGETEAEFERTLDVLERVGFDSLFAFMYSPRPGTTAWRLEDDVPAAEKRRRLGVINALQQRRQVERNRSRVGMQEEVLVDTIGRPGRLSGRTPHFRIVHFDGSEELMARLVRVDVDGAGPNALQGRLAQAIH